MKHIFTSESVSEGHPDKVADQISDALLDAALSKDDTAHVAAESFVGPDFAANLGEITCKGWETVDTEAIVRSVVRDIGYDRPAERFSFDTLVYENHLQGQSPDIAQGVNRGGDENQGAGDQGMMFGFATTETPELMPAPLALAHRLINRFTRDRHDGKVEWLRPDAKSQVSVLYDGHKPVRITDIVLSHQTTEKVTIEEIRRTVEKICREELSDVRFGDCPAVDDATVFHINPTGRFVIGGPAGDSGLTGRKIVVDSYGGSAAHGGGAFSGKDPSKVDRSAAYYARYAAKNLVAAGLADRCQIEVSYAIGVAKPVSIFVDFYGTGHGVSEETVTDMLLSSDVFDFRPGKLIAELDLTHPTHHGWSYRQTVNGGHFGRGLFPWEKCDKVSAIRAALGL